jgi:hypothetical protein
VPTTAAAMREHHNPLRPQRHAQRAFERGRAGGHPHELLISALTAIYGSRAPSVWPSIAIRTARTVGN